MLSENGYKQISEVWLTGGCGEDENSPLYPCGICLQRIAELGNDNTIIYSVSSSTKKVIKFHLKELLPYSNTFKDDIPLSETKIDFSTTSNDMYVILQILLKRNFAPDNKKKEAVILKTDKNHLIFGGYFSSCCYKADIHAINMAIYNFLLSEYKNENITDLFYYTSDQKGLFIHPEFQKIIKDAIITKFRY